MPPALVALLRLAPATHEPAPAKTYACADPPGSAAVEADPAIVREIREAMERSCTTDALCAWQEAKLVVTERRLVAAYNDAGSAVDASHEDAEAATKHVHVAVMVAAQTLRPAKVIDDGQGDERVCTAWTLTGAFQVDVHTTYDVAVLLQRAIDVHDFPTTLHFADYLKALQPASLTTHDLKTMYEAEFAGEARLRPNVHGYEWAGPRVDRRSVIVKSQTRWMREYKDMRAQNRRMARELDKQARMHR